MKSRFIGDRIAERGARCFQKVDEVAIGLKRGEKSISRLS